MTTEMVPWCNFFEEDGYCNNLLTQAKSLLIAYFYPSCEAWTVEFAIKNCKQDVVH